MHTDSELFAYILTLSPGDFDRLKRAIAVCTRAGMAADEAAGILLRAHSGRRQYPTPLRNVR